MNYASPELIQHLAASYVLGNLQAPTRRRFERLLRERVDVRLAVAQWQDKLATLASSIPALEPSESLWARIAEQTIQVTTARPVQSSNWLARFWPAFFGVIGGAMACLLLLSIYPQWLTSTDEIAMKNQERLPQSYVGVLSDAHGKGRLLVSSLRHGTKVSLKVLGRDSLGSPGSPQEALYLWGIPANGAPLLIGQVPQKGSAQLVLPDTSEKLLSTIPTLAVTKSTNPESAMDAKQHIVSGPCAKLW